MSMHTKPLTAVEEEGLRLHGLAIGTPSQLSDAFRQGVAWAQKAALATPHQPEDEGLEVVGLQWLDTGHYRKNPPKYGYNPYDWNELVRLSDHQRAIAELREEISDLHTTMMAAAVEIQEHWQAHCDEEGYGPANLMHRLERGIASQYGYTAQTLVQIESERDTLRQQLAERDAEILEQCRLNGMGAERELKLIAQRDKLVGLLLEAHSAGRSRRLTVDELYRIDAALAEVNE